MPKTFKKRPLGTWPDDEKHQVVKSPQRQDEETQEGHASNPEEIQGRDVVERANEMGLYSDMDEEHPLEVGVAQEEDKDIQEE